MLLALAVFPGAAAARGPETHAAPGGQEVRDGAPPDTIRADDDPFTVYLLTAGPGEQVWERFGHNALWVHDARTGEDVVWNWGLFSFSQTGFIPRLIQGEMLYWMAGFDLEATLAEYEAAGRPVWVQELALTPAQEAELDRLVRVNARPENRFYRYDYYRDNCSTRVRDVLDAVLDGRIRQAYDPVPAGVTWRWHTLRLLREAPLARTGVQVVLGNPGDEAISAWQEMFLPMRLRARVAELTVPGPDGSRRPLVVREDRLVQGRLPPPATEPDSRVGGFLVAGLLGSAVLALLGGAARRGARVAHWAFAFGLALWGTLASAVGLILVGAYLTDHAFWHANENLFQASPLHLGVAVAGLLLLGRRTAPAWAVGWARLLAALALLGLMLKPLPWLDQGNLEIVALTLPVNLAAAWALSRLQAPRPGPGDRAGIRAAA